MNSAARPRPRTPARLRLEALEDRTVPYVLSGSKWANANLSFSFVPDGTAVEGATSSLFTLLNATSSTATWQREVARALQTWANESRLNFRLTSDPSGDIRIGAVPQSGSLAYAYYPSAGDVFLNPAIPFQVGTDYDLYSVVLHEFGHSLGIRHSDVGDAVMAPTYAFRTGLRPDDVAAIRAVYGARLPDSFDAAAANDALGSATPLGTDSNGRVSASADLTTLGDVDYYRVVATGSSLAVTLDARNLSLLAPKVLVYNSAGALLGSATADYGQSTTLSLNNLIAGQTYYIVSDGASGDAFGMGAYSLSAAFSGAAGPAAPTAPSNLGAVAASSSQINLTWQDNSSNEDGFRIERSTDGTNFSFVANAGANANGYAVTGLAASTTYYFRVRAFNAGGDSAWSNTAQATTHAAGLSADRFEVNDRPALARNFGRISATSQPGLTVHSGTDVDYFLFTAATTGRYTVRTGFQSAGGNLDFVVLNSTKSQIGSGTWVGDGDAVTLSLVRGRKYYVKVIGANGATNAYNLSIEATGALRNNLLSSEPDAAPERHFFFADGSCRDEGHDHSADASYTCTTTGEGCGCPNCASMTQLYTPAARPVSAVEVSVEGLMPSELGRGAASPGESVHVGASDFGALDSKAEGSTTIAPMSGHTLSEAQHAPTVMGPTTGLPTLQEEWRVL